MKLGYLPTELYDLTMAECIDLLENRREGMAYEMWKIGSLSQLMKQYPSKPEEACPELFKAKKGVPMPDFLKKKYMSRKGMKVIE